MICEAHEGTGEAEEDDVEKAKSNTNGTTSSRWPNPEDVPPDHPVHKDRLTYCRTCGGDGRKRGHRTAGCCNTCGGSGKTSRDSKGRVIAWTRKGWIVR